MGQEGTRKYYIPHRKRQAFVEWDVVSCKTPRKYEVQCNMYLLVRDQGRGYKTLRVHVGTRIVRTLEQDGGYK